MIERAGPGDLLQRATDIGPVPMQVGAVLVLDRAVDAEELRRVVGRRLVAVPRLRQRMVDTPIGCGRPVWVDHPGFAVEAHVRAVACPAPGNEEALLALAADLVTRRLPEDRPLWTITHVTGLAAGGDALVATFHHVLADGIGGLAVLGALVDGPVIPLDPRPFPGRAPTTVALLVDAWCTRLASVTHLRRGWRRIRAAARELRSAERARAAPSSLNRPTGPRRAFALARVDLAAVVDAAHRRDATVNDVVLTAVGATLRATLERRGEPAPDDVVVSVPVSSRRSAAADALGNEVGVRPMAVPTVGTPDERLVETARRRRAVAGAPAGASQALLGPAFRALARLGLFRWFIERQRLIHTFVTNLRGPSDRLTLLGAEITEMVPLTSVAGNVTVAFAVLSYAGTLLVTVVADPDACPDLEHVRADLQSQLGHLVLAPESRARATESGARTGRVRARGRP